jgi:DNA processing protein
VDDEKILGWCREHATELVIRGTASYPSLLNELPDAPPILFARGTFLPQDQLAVAIVGTRHATSYGLKQAYRFATELAQAGVTIVSGLARGIDAAAHRGAIDGGGRTLAVLGSGMANLYPPEHKELAESIREHGVVISEYAPDAKPRSGMFPQRNRLISGLSLATFVVEAPERSGALITTRLASEQNREVLALPGPITSRASRGCNHLIRDGAKLIQSVDDILEELGPLHAPVRTSDGHQIRSGSELSLNEIERKVLETISPAGSFIDQVIQESELPASRVIAAISVLEMKRLVRRCSGQQVLRV